MRKTRPIAKVILLSFFLTLFFLNTHAQKVSLSVQNESFENVIQSIKQQTGLVFVFSEQLVDLNRKVSINLNSVQVEEALIQLLKGTNLSFEINNNKLYLVEKKAEQLINEPSKSKKITGLVTDEKGEPIVGASVVLKGSNTGTITNIDGVFTLETQNQSLITISYIGYKQTTLKVGADVNYKVVLEEDSKFLDEVVVVGFGTQKKVNLTGAVSVINSKDINDRPVTSAAHALQGLDPALNIGINSGKANSGYTIDIRGTASLNGGSPLILVDGVEMELNRLNPNDIESVSILKDASAASVYGTKASSGVVLITTKSGGGSKVKVSYNGRLGVLQNTTSTDYVTDGYDWLRTVDTFWAASNKSGNYTKYTATDYAELWMRRGDSSENSSLQWAVAQSDGSYKYYGNFDWYGYLFKRSRTQQEHNVSIRGGNDKVKYFVSSRYFGSEGIMNIQNDPYDTYSIRSKVDVNITKWLRYHNNISYFYGKAWWPGMTNPQYIFSGVTYGAAPYIPALNPDGTIVHQNPNSNQTADVAGGYNLMLTYGKNSNTEIENEITIKNGIDIDILKGLALHSSYSYTFAGLFNQNRYTIAPYSTKVGVITWTPDDPSAKFRNELNESNRSTYKQSFETYADYIQTWNSSHNFKTMAGMQYDTRYYHQNKITANGMLSEDLNDFNLAAPTLYQVSGGKSRYKTLGFFGRLNYDYEGRYLVEISGRADGSSRFWKKNRWAFFPSASFGWRTSEEKFFKSMSSWWNNAKLRFSIGSLGNQQVSDYLFIDEIDTKQSNPSYTLDGTNPLAYSQESAPVASNLTWEKVTTYDVGVDLGFFNRINITADYYIRNTTDIMVAGASLPAVYGASVPKQNAADIRTNGWEIGITYHDNFKLRGSKFTYNIRANIGDYTTKVTRFDNETGKIGDHYVGETLGELWGWRTDGLFRSDEEAQTYASTVDLTYLQKYIADAKPPYTGWMAGDLKYLDLDGDNKLSLGSSTISNPGDRTVIGNILPRYSYSFGGDISYNGIDFSVLFQGVGKRDWYPGAGESNLFWGSYCRPHNTFLSQQMIDNMWSEDNPDAYFPRPRGYAAYSGNYSHNAVLTAINDRYLQNVAYLRLKNLTLGYTLPINKYIERLRVYITGENIFYWSPMKKYNKYIDPEQAVSGVSAYADDKNQGIGSGEVYNFSKVFSVGIDITL